MYGHYPNKCRIKWKRTWSMKWKVGLCRLQYMEVSAQQAHNRTLYTGILFIGTPLKRECHVLETPKFSRRSSIVSLQGIGVRSWTGPCAMARRLLARTSSPSQVDRIWGIWGSYYTMPKAVFYLLQGDYSPTSFNLLSIEQYEP